MKPQYMIERRPRSLGIVQSEANRSPGRRQTHTRTSLVNPILVSSLNIIFFQYSIPRPDSSRHHRCLANLTVGGNISFFAAALPVTWCLCSARLTVDEQTGSSVRHEFTYAVMVDNGSL